MFSASPITVSSLFDKNKTKLISYLTSTTKESYTIPESVEIFRKYGLGCIGCAAAHFENLEAGAKVHGFDADAMVEEINALVE